MIGRLAGREHRQGVLGTSRSWDRPGLDVLGAAAFLYALWRGDWLLVALLSVFFASSRIARYYSTRASRSLKLTLAVLPRRVFPGKPVEVRVRIANRGRLPLPWLRLELHLPRRVEVQGLTLQKSPLDAVLQLPFSLGPHEQVERRLALQMPHRGLMRVAQAAVHLTDPLGIEDSHSALEGETTFLCYPRLHDIHAEVREAMPLGERRGRSFLDEQSRYLGPRPYQPTDPLRRIDWRQSARRGDLFVRTYETVATAQTAIFLDPTTSRNAWDGIDTEVLERTVELTASLAHHLIERGQAVGLYVTGIFGEAAGKRPFSVRERPRGGPHQLGRILEALAQLRPPGLFRNLPLILLEELPTLDYQVQIVAVAPYLTRELQLALLRASRNHRTFFLQTGPAAEGDAALPPRVRPLLVAL